METGYTIVVGNQEQLSALCGVNDGNLRAIEDYLGATVVSRGNELTVATEDAEVCRKFQVLVDRVLSDETARDASPDLLASLIATMDRDTASASRAYVQIPNGTRRVYPKTVKQADLIMKIRTHDIVFATGPAGTGKTYIAVAAALSMVLSRQIRKIVLTRPVVEAGENLGFLPGDLGQKINPYLRPLIDTIENLVCPDAIRRMEESRMIELAPLAYMRGRTLDNSVILLDEAQNTTKEQMKMFLTRLGEGSKMIITGDPSQTDLPSRSESGLSHALKIVGNIDEIAVVELDDADIVRNPLVKKIVREYDSKK